MRKIIFGITGMTMASALVSAGVASGVALVVAELMKRIGEGQREVASIQDQIEIQKEVALLIGRKKHCKASLVFDDPADGTALSTTETFKKDDIDDYEGGEFRRVELWTSKDEAGTRGAKKFFDGQKYGKLTVESVALSFDSSTGPFPASKASHPDLGAIYVVVSKKQPNNTTRRYLFRYPVEVEVETDGSTPVKGKILSCQAVASGGGGNTGPVTVEDLITEPNLTSVGENTGGDTGYNTFIGANAGKHVTGDRSTMVGHLAGAGFNLGDDTIAPTTIAGHNNTFIGTYSGQYAKGHENTYVGALSGNSTSSSSYNVHIGYRSGRLNKDAQYNVIIGYNAGRSTGNSPSYLANSNVFIGAAAGQSTIGVYGNNPDNKGSFNTFIGRKSGMNNTKGKENTFLGTNSGEKNTEGNYNTFLGTDSGASNETGKWNVAVGYQAGGGASDTSKSYGQNNVFVGAGAGKNTEGDAVDPSSNKGNFNTFVGRDSGAFNTTGKNNICIGYKSCNAGTTADNKIVIGIDTNQAASISNYSRPSKPGDGNILLGNHEDPNFLKERSYSLAINNIIEGDFVNKWVLIKDDLKVRRHLHVGGEIKAPRILAQVSTPSDGRIKDIQKILSPEKSLSKLLSLQGVRYTYTEEGYPEGAHLGFLAEEVKKVIPEIVGKDGEDEMLSIRYDEFLPLVVEGMKKLREENTQLAEENTQLAQIKTLN